MIFNETWNHELEVNPPWRAQKALPILNGRPHPSTEIVPILAKLYGVPENEVFLNELKLLERRATEEHKLEEQLRHCDLNPNSHQVGPGLQGTLTITLEEDDLVKAYGLFPVPVDMSSKLPAAQILAQRERVYYRREVFTESGKPPLKSGHPSVKIAGINAGEDKFVEGFHENYMRHELGKECILPSKRGTLTLMSNTLVHAGMHKLATAHPTLPHYPHYPHTTHTTHTTCAFTLLQVLLSQRAPGPSSCMVCLGSDARYQPMVVLITPTFRAKFGRTKSTRQCS